MAKVLMFSAALSLFVCASISVAEDSIDISDLREEFALAGKASNKEAKDGGFVLVEEGVESPEGSRDFVYVGDQKINTSPKTLPTKPLVDPEAATKGDKAFVSFDLEGALEKEKALLERLESEGSRKAAPAPEKDFRAGNERAVSMEHSKQIKELQTKQTSLSKKVKAQTSTISTLKGSKRSLESKLSKAQIQVKKLSKQLEEAQNRLMIAETEVDRLSSVLEARNKTARVRLGSAERVAPRPRPAQVSHKRGSPQSQARVRPVRSQPQMRIATVTVNKANLRTGPGKHNSPLMTVAEGTRLAIETRQGSWYRVIAPSGERAWVSSTVVRFGGTKSASPSRTVSIKGYDPSVEDEAFRLINDRLE